MTETEKLKLKMQGQIEEAHRYQGQLMDEIANLQRLVYEWTTIACDLHQVAKDLDYALDIQVSVYTKDGFLCVHGREARAKLKSLQAKKPPTE